MLIWVTQSLRKIRIGIDSWHHRRRLKQKMWQRSHAYEQYLDIQLHRTLSKKETPLQTRTKSLIDKAAELVDLAKCDVLCVGSRNTAEIDYFRSKGAKNVVGIDLYSEYQDILVIDMHDMTFPDNHFDVIYSSHSLEHAYDVQKVISEIIRVGRSGALVVIEVPIRYETRGADLVDFGSCANIHAVFEPCVEKVLWCEEQEPSSPSNSSGTAIARTIFSLK